MRRSTTECPQGCRCVDEPAWRICSNTLVQGTTCGRETILLVEDEPALRALCCRVLQNHGYRVFPAGTGVEALSVWRKQASAIHLLLTDMVMPGRISGRELAEQLKAENGQLKVIYTTGYTPDAVAENFTLREGINFLAKPYRPHVLAKAVRDCLDGASRPV